MRVLAGGVINEDPSVLSAHLKTLRWQDADAEVDYAFILDPEAPDGLREQLPGLVETGDPKPGSAAYSVDESGHDWSEETFNWLAAQRQKLLDLARDQHYDAVWLVDSDLLLGPQTLRSLLNANKPITSAVFWTRWNNDQPALPQVWLNHPYEMNGRGWQQHEFLSALYERRLVQVYGLGACTLARTEHLGRVRYHPLLEGLPSGGMWGGEDRSFCIRAERARVDMYADAWPDIFHVYRPSDREQIDDRLQELKTRPKSEVEPNDLVSFTVEPLEEPELSDYAAHVRGRLAGLDLLPQLEYTLRELPVGESAITKLHFPIWYDLDGYRGQSKVVRVTLHGAKHYASPPNLETEDPKWNRFYTPQQLQELRA